MSESALPEGVRRSLEEAEAIMKAVNHAIMSSGVSIEDLGVAASADGKVAISGIVRSIDDGQRAGRAAASVSGVTGVINTILVLGPDAR